MNKSKNWGVLPISIIIVLLLLITVLYAPNADGYSAEETKQISATKWNEVSYMLGNVLEPNWHKEGHLRVYLRNDVDEVKQVYQSFREWFSALTTYYSDKSCSQSVRLGSLNIDESLNKACEDKLSEVYFALGAYKHSLNI